MAQGGPPALLCDVETSCAVWVIIPAAKELAEYGVVPMTNGLSPRPQLWRGTRNVRFLDTLWLDVPPCEIVLQHAKESFFGVCAILRAKRGRTMMAEESERTLWVTRRERGHANTRTRRTRGEGINKWALGHSDADMKIPLPKDEVRMGHEVRDTFEHTARFENKGRECHL